MGGKKTKGRKRSQEQNVAMKEGPSTPSPRLSASAAEWHPPPFLMEKNTATNENKPEAAELEVCEDNKSAAAAATGQSCPIAPPTTPREHEVREDGSMPIPTAFEPRDCTTTTTSDEPTRATITSSSTPIGGDCGEAAENGAPLEVALEEDGDTAAISAAQAMTATSSEETSQLAQAAPLPELVLENSEDCATIAPDEVSFTAIVSSPGKGDSGNPCEVPGGSAAAAVPDTAAAPAAENQAVPDLCVAKEATDARSLGATGVDKARGISEEEADGARGGEQPTDATSNPTDDSGSDPDLSDSGKGDGRGHGIRSQSFRGRFLDDPKWRWGGVVALAATALLFGLRRR